MHLLTVDFAGNDFFEDDIIYRDTAHDIVKILADTNKLYVLARGGPEYFLKIFNLGPDLELVPMGVLSNLELSNPVFIDEFK